MEHIPKRHIGDHVQVMFTDDAKKQGIAGRRGLVVEVTPYNPSIGQICKLRLDGVKDYVEVASTMLVTYKSPKDKG